MTGIVTNVAKVIAGQLGDKRVRIKHKRAASEAVLAIADALVEMSNNSDEETGINLGAVGGFLIEEALEGAPPLPAKARRQLAADLAELEGPDGEIYGFRD